MTEQTLQDRLRRAKLVEEYNDQMFDESADRIDELQAEVARLSNTLLTISILEGEYRQSGRIARAALAHKD